MSSIDSLIRSETYKRGQTPVIMKVAYKFALHYLLDCFLLPESSAFWPKNFKISVTGGLRPLGPWAYAFFSNSCYCVDRSLGNRAARLSTFARDADHPIASYSVQSGKENKPTIALETPNSISGKLWHLDIPL